MHHSLPFTDLEPRQAGRIMATRMPVILPEATISEVEALLLKKTRDLDTINYIYVTDRENKLIGVISIKEIFRSPKDTRIESLMKRELVTVRPHTDQKRVILIAILNRLKEVPVVDADNHLLGIVPYDVILNLLNQEHIDDALRAAGVRQFTDATTLANASVPILVKKRLPWLLVGIIGSTVVAVVIGYFREILEAQLLLVSFIPAVMYLAGAVGTQSETMFIRSIMIDRNFSLLKYLRREITVGISLAAFLAFVGGLLSLFIWRTPSVSVILGATILISVIISMIVAILLPWFFAKFKVDPAVVGGPLDTILSDIISIAVYFSFATLLFKLWM